MSFGHQLVEKLNIATIAGLPFAIAMYFWANRLIPVPFDGRADWEVHSLFIAWLLTLIYAIFRPLMKAWREILAFAALAWLLLPILNFFTTDRHLGVAIPYGAWVLVNIEIGLMLIGLLLLWATLEVQKKINTPIPIKNRLNGQSMMKFFNFSDIVKYRWMVFGRCFLAAVGGFLIASISVSLIALSSEQKALATYTGLIISFIMWLLIIIYVFSVKSSIKAWWAILIILMVKATVN